MLKRFEIYNLFGEYSYVLDWEQSSYPGLLYITGPNGMGKTTILRMIAGLAHFTPDEYVQFPFKSAVFVFDGNERISLNRCEVDLESNLKTDEIPNKEVTLACEYVVEKQHLKQQLSIREKKEWKYVHDVRNDQWTLKNETDGNLINMMMQLSDQCRFFQDDRIFHSFDGEYEQKCIDPKTLRYFLVDLQMGLDNAFMFKPDCVEDDDRIDVNNRKIKVLKVLDFLRDNDIYIGGYDQYKRFLGSDGTELTLLIKRLENAIHENRENIRRLNAYLKAINRFGFVGKKLLLSPRYGYRIVPTSSEKPLKFNDLASGEKHLLCLLNGLFFVQTESPLVLIDEPEMSYHMYWQMQFCKTVKEAIKLMGLRMLIATHAPMMFDGDFSLTADLYRQHLNR